MVRGVLSTSIPLPHPSETTGLLWQHQSPLPGDDADPTCWGLFCRETPQDLPMCANDPQACASCSKTSSLP